MPSRRCVSTSVPTSPQSSTASAPTRGSVGRFLNPGPGWGGSCFPKDSRALVKIAEDHGYDFSMMRGVITVNDEQRRRMVDKIAKAVGRHPSDLSGVTRRSVGAHVQGRHRRPPRIAGDGDHRRAPQGRRQRQGVRPDHGGRSVAAPGDHARRHRVGAELMAVADDVDVMCVLTEWPEFAKIDLDELAASCREGNDHRRHPQPARPGRGEERRPPLRRRRPTLMRVVVAGGAGFLGSQSATA